MQRATLRERCSNVQIGKRDESEDGNFEGGYRPGVDMGVEAVDVALFRDNRLWGGVNSCVSCRGGGRDAELGDGKGEQDGGLRSKHPKML